MSEDTYKKINKKYKTLKLENYNENIIKEFVKKNKTELIVSLNFPNKISKKILSIIKHGGINLHLGLLPECGGPILL